MPTTREICNGPSSAEDPATSAPAVDGTLIGLLVDVLPDGILIHQNGRIVYANPAAARQMGVDDPQCLVNQPVREFWAPDERVRLGQETDLVYRSGSRPKITAFSRRRPDGSFIQVESTAVRIEWQGMPAILAVVRDVTDYPRSRAALEASEQRFRELIEVLPAAVVIHQGDEIVYANPEARIQFGASAPEQLLGRDYFEFFGPDEQVVMAERRNQMFATGEKAPLAYRRLRRIDGGIASIETTAVPINWHGKGAILGLSHDITKRLEIEDRNGYLATHDVLTGLCNRVNFLKTLDERMAECGNAGMQIAVHFIDLDDFKEINDSRGHSVGDRFLCLAAERLAAAISVKDVVARLGGDEFAVLQSGITSIDEVSILAETIRQSLNAPYELDGQRFYTSATIGVALFPGDGSSADDLLRKADLALYDGKAAGGDVMRRFDQRLVERQRHREEMLRELEDALANQQFMVHYQPIVALATGRVTGVEALIRWQHPVQGLLRADRFITVLEATPWFPDVGAYVLRQACRQAKAWHDQGFSELRMSVNLSMYQIKQPGLVELVAEVLKETRLDPGALELELTESAILSAGLADVAEVLQRLRDLGVHIALDDFGTGYSSLTFLKRFPVGRIKIDRSFVAGLGACEEDAAIVRAVIQLGKNLDIDVTAEGVETMAAASFLLKAGCGEQQGFMMGPPMPAERMAEFLERRRMAESQIQINVG